MQAKNDVDGGAGGERPGDRAVDRAGSCAASEVAPADRRWLASLIEGEIVPRLMMLRRASMPPDLAYQTHEPEPDEVSEFARLLLAHDAPVASAFVEAIRQSGASYQGIYLNLLAPTARQLAELCDRENVDLAELQRRLETLRSVLLRFTENARREIRGDDGRRSSGPSRPP
jgi:MerR family transcriptional regulator, light-induced transcriptional regulator